MVLQRGTFLTRIARGAKRRMLWRHWFAQRVKLDFRPITGNPWAALRYAPGVALAQPRDPFASHHSTTSPPIQPMFFDIPRHRSGHEFINRLAARHTPA